MADFEVKVRNLETGEMLVAGMPDSDHCIEWPRERPKNLEIVSVLSDTSPAESRRLKEAMRPYDADCGEGKTCVDGACKPKEGWCAGDGDCENGQVCKDHACVACQADNECGEGAG